MIQDQDTLPEPNLKNPSCGQSKALPVSENEFRLCCQCQKAFFGNKLDHYCAECYKKYDGIADSMDRMYSRGNKKD